jgi:ketosteroid isomerase-like protein
MTALTAFTRYADALAAGDMEALAGSLHADVVWHQPGAHSLAGDHVGRDGVLQLLGGFMQRSNGTFALQPTGGPMVNGDVVALPVSFSAQAEGKADLDMTGVDLFRVADDLVAEVWLFSADQEAEDLFWG